MMLRSWFQGAFHVDSLKSPAQPAMPLKAIDEDDMSDAPLEPADQPQPTKKKEAKPDATTPKGELAPAVPKGKAKTKAKAKGQAKAATASDQQETEPAPTAPTLKPTPKGAPMKRPSASISSGSAPQPPVAKKPATKSDENETAYKDKYHKLAKWGVKYRGHEITVVGGCQKKCVQTTNKLLPMLKQKPPPLPCKVYHAEGLSEETMIEIVESLLAS